MNKRNFLLLLLRGVVGGGGANIATGRRPKQTHKPACSLPKVQKAHTMMMSPSEYDVAADDNDDDAAADDEEVDRSPDS